MFNIGDYSAQVTRLLDFAQDRLWHAVDLGEDEVASFRQACWAFYRRKTEARARQLREAVGMEDRGCTINGRAVGPLGDYLEGNIDWEWLCDGFPSSFHGDFNLSNIILATDGSFKFIDYRQDFAGDEHCGDRYYDLAKLYHSFLWPHPSAKAGYYCLHKAGESVVATIDVPEALEKGRRIMEGWAEERSYDVRKIKVLAALVLLNIAPLHERTAADPTLPRSDEHLYYLGRYHLARFLDPAQA